MTVDPLLHEHSLDNCDFEKDVPEEPDDNHENNKIRLWHNDVKNEEYIAFTKKSLKEPENDEEEMH